MQQRIRWRAQRQLYGVVADWEIRRGKRCNEVIDGKDYRLINGQMCAGATVVE